MRKIWAVAINTIRQALRLKVAAIFILLLLILLPVLGFTATGDGTLKGRLQTFVSYGLSLTGLLLSLLTIIVSIYAITSDIEQRQIYTVVTKPIRRFQIVLGKLLGVVVLDVVLLALFAGIVYALTVYMPRFFKASPQELAQVKNEFYTARASLVPPKIDVEETVNAIYLQKKDELEQLWSGMTRQEMLKELTTLERMKKQAAAVGQWLDWEFKNVKPLDPEKNLFIRFKYDVSVTPPDEQVYGDWYIGDLRQMRYGAEINTTIYRVPPRKDPVRQFREIAVPADAVADDGYLGVRFINPTLNQTVVLFPLEDGLEVLYKADTFTGNYIRGTLLILCRLVFLACLGGLAGSFLSFPVAILFCLVIFLTGTVSGFVLESFEYLSRNVGFLYTYTIKQFIHLLPRFDLYNPTKFLIPGRLLPWWAVGKVVFFMVCVKALLLLVLSLIVFSFRELARIII
ncbi:MAG: hypothetical protein JW741_08460 [Sedimentisphaerales bacterium]|nr:hypothetical protein [Sedimentisphaerales bacterium]